jgi:fission process protein 1
MAPAHDHTLAHEDAAPGPHPEHDIWRHSPLRFAGYANELGEAFRPLVSHAWVNASYAVAIAYVLGDTYDKASTAGRQATARGENPTPQVLTTALDVLSWQTIASVAVPGFIINRVVALSGAVLRRAGRQPGVVPTLVGLASVPLIIKPIDHGTDAVLDATIRPAIERYHAGPPPV